MEKAVKEELEQKVTELKRFCKDKKIPVCICFADVNNGKATYTPTVVTPVECGYELNEIQNDLITPTLIMFKDGFKTTPVNLEIFDSTELFDDID